MLLLVFFFGAVTQESAYSQRFQSTFVQVFMMKELRVIYFFFPSIKVSDCMLIL